MKKNNNKKIVLVAMIVVVLIAILYLSNKPITGSAIADISSYEFSRAKNPEYYSLLPPKPSDFEPIQLMWQRGIISDDTVRINESYWKQPEWFPSYDKFLLSLKSTAEDKRLPVWSLGIFDSQIYRRINQEWLQSAKELPKASGYGILEIKDKSIVVKHRFWVRAVPGAIKIYGVGLSVVYPQSTYLKGNTLLNIPNETIAQDPEITQKYIKSWTYETESGRTEFNMGTYWPILSPDYVKEIELTTEIDKNIPKGIYVIGVDAGAPSKEYQEQQSLKYLLSYTDPNIGMFAGPSGFRLFIEVI